ncbi:hypothetical protein FB451DRAFT_1181850 [Mycena latifolia]|nr:hypothetical protein FB451DRAFT_1181850 [Mycena latifolia]
MQPRRATEAAPPRLTRAPPSEVAPPSPTPSPSHTDSSSAPAHPPAKDASRDALAGAHLGSVEEPHNARAPPACAPSLSVNGLTVAFLPWLYEAEDGRAQDGEPRRVGGGADVERRAPRTLKTLIRLQVPAGACGPSASPSPAYPPPRPVGAVQGRPGSTACGGTPVRGKTETMEGEEAFARTLGRAPPAPRTRTRSSAPILPDGEARSREAPLRPQDARRPSRTPTRKARAAYPRGSRPNDTRIN